MRVWDGCTNDFADRDSAGFAPSRIGGSTELCEFRLSLALVKYLFVFANLVRREIGLGNIVIPDALVSFRVSR